MTTAGVDLSRFSTGLQLAPGTVRAHNTSSASENKIHDDEVARQYGFGGGLVPGATSYAYLASWLVQTLGVEWAMHGSSSIALIRPVYEGESVTLGGSVREASGDAQRGALTVDCHVAGPDGEIRAPGTAGLTWGADPVPAPRPAFAAPGSTPRLRDQRPTISKATAPLGEPLPPVLLDAGPDATTAYLDGIGNQDPLFRAGSPFGGPLAHPGWWPGIANRVLAENFALGPWIHTRSEIQHLGPALLGGRYHAYGVITDAFEKRGHEYVTADVLITDAADVPVVRMSHTAIVVVARRA